MQDGRDGYRRQIILEALQWNEATDSPRPAARALSVALEQLIDTYGGTSRLARYRATVRDHLPAAKRVGNVA